MGRSNKSRLTKPKKKKKTTGRNGITSVASRLKNVLKNKIIGKTKASQFRAHANEKLGINLKRDNDDDVFLVMSKDKPNQTFFFRDNDGPKVLVDRKDVPINEMNVDADIHKLKNVASQTIMQDGERFPRMILVSDTKPLSMDEAKDIAKQILEGANADGGDVQLKVAVRMFQGEDGKFHYRFRVLTPSEVNLMNEQRANLPPPIANRPTDIAVLDATMNAEQETDVSLDELVSRLPSPPTDSELSEDADESFLADSPRVEEESDTESQASRGYVRPPAELAEVESREEKSSEDGSRLDDADSTRADNIYGQLVLIPPPPELDENLNYQSLALLPHEADGNSIFGNGDFNPPAEAAVNSVYDVVRQEDLAAAAAAAAATAATGRDNQYDDFTRALADDSQYESAEAAIEN